MKDSAGRQVLWIVIVAALALGARIGFQVVAGMHAPPADDAIHYDDIGWRLANGGPYATADGLRSNRAPLFPFVLAATYIVAGHEWAVARVVQALLDTLTAILMLLWGSHLFGSRAGRAAAMAYAACPFPIFWSSVLVSEPLCTLLTLAATVLLYIAVVRGGAATALWAAGCALTSLVRPNMALMFLVGLGIIAVQGVRRVPSITIAVAVFAVVLMPWTVRNYLVHQRLVFVTTMGGRVLWESNNPYVASDPSMRGRALFVEAIPESKPALGMPETAADVYYFGLASAWIRQNPGSFARLVMWKMRRLFNIVPDIEGGLRRLVVSVAALILLGGFLAGVGSLAWKRDPALPVLLTPFVAVLGTAIVYWADARIRAPAEPTMILIAAGALLGSPGRAERTAFS